MASEIMHRLKTRPFQYIGVVLVLVIIVIAFVFVPAIVPGGRGADFTFGSYNKEPIRYAPGNVFHQVHQNLIREQQLSGDDPNAFFINAQIWRRAFEEMVVYMAIQDEVRQAGNIIPESVIDREIAMQFQENGRFAAAAYRSLDNATRLNLRRETRERLALRSYFSALASIKDPPGEAAFIASMASPRRSFNVAIFPFSSYPDSEVAAYAQANRELFRRTHLSKITLATEREARQVLDMVQSGVTTFEDAAQNNSQDWFRSRGGDMGLRAAHELVSEIPDARAREAVINLSEGTISDIISVPAGWAFFRAEAAAAPLDTDDPAQLEPVRNYLIINERGIIENWLLEEVESFSVQLQTRSFDAVANEGNVARNTFGPLPLNYGDQAMFAAIGNAGVPELLNAGHDMFFWRAAFSTPLNMPSDPVVLGNNIVVLVPTEESNADEFTYELIESYFPSRIEGYINMALRSYFLNDNDKLDDRFDSMFQRIWN